ncbi:hypothetical protein LSTR_LSTR014592 [Laodelphax striatellus]|uniref:Uncharacterized protein n=1 Tax=Laodelphax striatellus TaxID=195883 RepID=A0A482XSS7_LAOST|nr:hypothetical protein LSTR_LSTR014592 [Laodelphax striatellus]
MKTIPSLIKCISCSTREEDEGMKRTSGGPPRIEGKIYQYCKNVCLLPLKQLLSFDVLQLLACACVLAYVRSLFRRASKQIATIITKPSLPTYQKSKHHVSTGTSTTNGYSYSKRASVTHITTPKSISELPEGIVSESGVYLPGLKDVNGRAIIVYDMNTASNTALTARDVAKLLLYYSSIPLRTPTVVSIIQNKMAVTRREIILVGYVGEL